MSTFTYDGETLPIPTLWQNVNNAEEWFYLIEKAKNDCIFQAEKKYQEPVYDSDGDQVNPQTVLLMKDYGFESGHHWEIFQREYTNQKWNTTGEDMTNFLWKMGDIGRKKVQAEIEAKEKDGGVLSPIEGITVELWAKANAKLASGGTMEDAYQICSCDAAKWDRVNTEWLARMSNDTEMKIMNIYSAAFNTSATGNMGAGSETNDNTISFEKFVEAMAAQDVLGRQGKDAQSVLADFGMTVSDYSNISSHWFGKMASDLDLAMKFSTLQNEYTQKYEAMAGDAHGDLEF
jgi:hypothetical protein